MPTSTKVAISGGNLRQNQKYPNGLTVAFSTGGALATLTTRTITATFKPAQVGQVVLATPRSALTDGLVPQDVRISAANTLSFAVTNITAGNVTPGDVVFDIVIL